MSKTSHIKPHVILLRLMMHRLSNLQANYTLLKPIKQTNPTLLQRLSKRQLQQGNNNDTAAGGKLLSISSIALINPFLGNRESIRLTSISMVLLNYSQYTLLWHHNISDSEIG